MRISFHTQVKTALILCPFITNQPIAVDETFHKRATLLLLGSIAQLQDKFPSMQDVCLQYIPLGGGVAPSGGKVWVIF